MTRICTILARGGSKGVPGKNLMRIAGRSLVGWSILRARQSGLFDMIAFSSESDDLLDLAREEGADLMVRRPDDLASDIAAKPPGIMHCLLEAEAALGRKADTFVDLSVTAPLRLAEDITGSVELLEGSDATNVFTGYRANHSPYFNILERDDTGSVHLSKPLPGFVARRQDAPVCYNMNGSIYVWRRSRIADELKVFYDDTLLYEMPDDRSVDLDSPLDLEIVTLLLNRQAERDAGISGG